MNGEVLLFSQRFWMRLICAITHQEVGTQDPRLRTLTETLL